MSERAIEQILSGGDPRSSGRAEEVAAAVLASRELVPELFECLFCSDEIVRMRAGDALEKVCRECADLLAPFAERLLNDVSRIEQPSVQWHLAQMLPQLPLSDAQTQRALAILKSNLATRDWIVENTTLDVLAKFTRRGAFKRGDLVRLLAVHEQSRHKSVRARVAKLQREFSKP